MPAVRALHGVGPGQVDILDATPRRQPLDEDARRQLNSHSTMT